MIAQATYQSKAAGQNGAQGKNDYRYRRYALEFYFRHIPLNLSTSYVSSPGTV